MLQKGTKLPLDNDGKPYEGDLQSIIPIGSVEFVLKYLNDYYNITNIKPLNIPDELDRYKYTKRKIFYSNSNGIIHLPHDKYFENLNPSTKFFVKSNDKIKGFTDIIQYKDIPQGEYLISELIDIDSEWRAFVFNNRLVGLQNYSGDFTLFPDVKLINEMVHDFNYNSTYTLDVGINKKDGTFIVECHDFFSCGLYGFSDYRVLPLMFINTWNKIIK
ncbi:MAG: ATP-grasp domain-containing protein [Clostridia bacterium]|jgi:hypothetical protein